MEENKLTMIYRETSGGEGFRMGKVNVLIRRGKTKQGGRVVGCVRLADQGALIRHGCDQTCAGDGRGPNRSPPFVSL